MPPRAFKLFLLLLIVSAGLVACSTSRPPIVSSNERLVRDIYVRSAEFGSGSHVADVTDRVSELLRNEPAGFSARADWLRADPLPGKAKTLVIDYDYKGHPFRFSVPSQSKVSYELLVENAHK